jgi:hypothetical protein
VLSPRQLMMVHSSLLRVLAKPFLPEGWSPMGFKTSGEVDVQRRALQTLCNRLAVVSICSFVCKTSSVALSFLARDHIVASLQLQTGLFLATILTVQALPSAITLVLLWNFLFSRDSSPGRATLMQSLLARDVGSSHIHGAVSGSFSEGNHVREIVMLQNQLSEMRAELEKANARLVRNAIEN